MQEWYFGWEKVSCLERCPQFRSVPIEREVYCSSLVFCGLRNDAFELSLNTCVSANVIVGDCWHLLLGVLVTCVS